jgi:hypothetical protein
MRYCSGTPFPPVYGAILGLFLLCFIIASASLGNGGPIAIAGIRKGLALPFPQLDKIISFRYYYPAFLELTTFNIFFSKERGCSQDALTYIPNASVFSRKPRA